MAIKKDLRWIAPDSGVVFELQPIPPLNFDDFNTAYDRHHPKPRPPMIEVTVVDKKLSQPNAADPYFVNELEDWSAQKESDSRHFILAKGVKNEPPEDWQPDDLLYSGELPKWKRKSLWVSDQLHSLRDITGLIEAIQSLNTVTETALDEAKKSTEPPLEIPTSSNGTSSSALIQSDLISR